MRICVCGEYSTEGDCGISAVAGIFPRPVSDRLNGLTSSVRDCRLGTQLHITLMIRHREMVEQSFHGTVGTEKSDCRRTLIHCDPSVLPFRWPISGCLTQLGLSVLSRSHTCGYVSPLSSAISRPLTSHDAPELHYTRRSIVGGRPDGGRQLQLSSALGHSLLHT